MATLMESTLRELLMDEGRVALPGLGTLIREDTAALLSGADRQVLPPSATVRFNENLTLNDGRLLRALVEKKGLLRTSAEMEVEQFLADVSAELNAGNSVELAKIGRLFKQFDGKITFTPAAYDLSRDAFGLPGVGFTPINRRAQYATYDPLAATVAGAVPPPAEPVRTRFRERGKQAVARLPREAWYVIVGALLLIGLLLLLWLFDAVGSQVVSDPRKPVMKRDGTRTEAPVVKPRPAPIAGAPRPARDIAPSEPPRLTDARRVSPAPATNTAPVRTTPAPAAAPTTPPARTPTRQPTVNRGADAGARVNGLNTAQIATGLFGSPANVNKNVLRIEQAGYKAFTRPAGKYTRIGVEVNYRTEAELARYLREVKQKFESSAFVMYVNGERVKR